MKVKPFRSSLVAVAVLAMTATTCLTGLIPIRPVSAGVIVITVTPSNLQTWQMQHAHCNGGTSTGAQEFEFGPASPPFGIGSLEFTVGSDGDSFETIRYPGLNNIRIDQLTSLSYYTYVTNFNDSQAPYILLNIDFDGDTTLDDQLFFEPVYQSAAFFPPNPQPVVVEGQWQQWNALGGGWWSLNNICGASPGTNVKSLTEYLSCQPNARIINTATGQGGFRIATGCGGAAWTDFDGNIDSLTIGVDGTDTIFNFEPDAMSCDLSPANDSNPVGTSHTVTVTVTSAGNPVAGQDVAFSIISGPNTGAMGICNPPTCVTNASGQVSFTYTSNGTAGTDIIQACPFIPTPGLNGPGVTCLTKCTASKTWETCVITCPAPITQVNDPNQCGAIVSYPAPTVNTACGTVTCTPLSGSFFPVGTTTVTCTSSTGPSCSFAITVIDNQPPAITCPPNQTQGNDPNQCGAVVNYPPPTATDNCPTVGTPVCSPTSGSFFPVGTTTVTCRVSDSTTCSNIFAVDVVNNLVNFPATQPGVVSIRPILGLMMEEFVIGIDFRPATGQLYGLAVNGTNARLITIDVATGATAQVGPPLTVSGTDFGFDFNPMADRIRITSDAEMNLSVNPDTGAVMPQTPLNPGDPNIVGSAYTNNVVGATSTLLYGIDSGSDMLVTQNPPSSGTLMNVGPLNVDTTGVVGFDISQCGGTAYATLSPVAPPDKGGSPRSQQPSAPAGGASSLYTIDLMTGTATLVGPITGNQIRGMSVEMARTSSCTFSVTVNDTQPPTITCPPNQTQSNDPNQCGAVVNYPPPSVSDNCPGVGMPMCSPASGSFFPVGTTTVTCTATDASGNSASCTFTVRVNDTQPPTITCPANAVAVTPTAGGTGVVVCFPPPTATDNCPGVTTMCVPASGSPFPVGTTTVTCTATDASGNTATCTFTVRTFNARLQDDSVPSTVVLWNTMTGDYIFCCGGTTFTGRGKTFNSGNNFVLDHNGTDRRVRASLSAGSFPPSGNASLQFNAGSILCTIRDRDTRDDTMVCGGAAPSTCNGGAKKER
jgi:uncharacterized protein DUF4394/HYR domain-containing protein